MLSCNNTLSLIQNKQDSCFPVAIWYQSSTFNFDIFSWRIVNFLVIVALIVVILTFGTWYSISLQVRKC